MDVVILLSPPKPLETRSSDPTHPLSKLNPQNIIHPPSCLLGSVRSGRSFVEAKKASSAVIGGGGLLGLEAAKAVAEMSHLSGRSRQSVPFHFGFRPASTFSGFHEYFSVSLQTRVEKSTKCGRMKQARASKARLYGFLVQCSRQGNECGSTTHDASILACSITDPHPKKSS